MRSSREDSPRRRYTSGTGRGIVGAMAMSGARQLLVGLGLIGRTPPEAVLAEGVPSILRAIPADRRTATIELAHWAYGGTAGTLYILLPAGIRRYRLSGPIYGVAVWAAYQIVVAPALGLAHAHQPRPAERLALFGDHVLYGLILDTPTAKQAKYKGTEP